MAPDLAPLRRAHALLELGRSVDDVIDDLCRGFGLDFVGAMAAVAACVMLSERGFSVPEEPFARPYV